MYHTGNITYIHFEQIDSTNTWAKENIDILDLNKLTCITASHQTAGRGRRGKPWVSPKGLNLYMTLFFSVIDSFPFVANIGECAAVVCAQTLERLGFAPQIKWPNDILIEKKKIAGILCETIPLPGALGVIVGIGINVNMPYKLLKEIDQPATSLLHASGHIWSLKEILSESVTLWTQVFSTFCKQGFPALHAYYEKHLAYKGEPFFWKQDSSTLLCRGLTAEGKLLAETLEGKTQVLSSNECSFLL